MPLPVFSRRRPAGADPEPASARRHEVPRHFEAVAEALVARRCPGAACAVAGTRLAADGVPLGEALSALRATYATCGRGEPAFAATEALSLAWSEETLAFLADVSCEDPLTGLASGAHLRARMAEVYREAAATATQVRSTHALLVVDLSPHAADLGPAAPDPFDEALRVAGAAEVVREFLIGGETLARVGRDKVVALVRRDDLVGPTVTRLRDALQQARVAARPRLWIEGMPDDPDGAVTVLAGLSLL